MLQRGRLVAKGQMAEGSLNGKAIVKLNSEFWFKGECRNDVFEGCGTLVARLPEVAIQMLPVAIPARVIGCHQGWFVGGQREGFGVSSWADGSIVAKWSQDKIGGYALVEASDEKFEGLVSGSISVGKKSGPDGKFHGQFKNGRRHGIGIWKTQSAYYIGQWSEGFASGHGEEVRQDGTKLQGEWNGGTLHGLALITMGVSESERSEYIGNVDNGQRNFFGKLEEPGSIYIGGWKHGLRCGRGYHKQADGVVYYGEWKDDLRNGIGLSQATGLHYLGEWVNDKPHGAGFVTSSSRVNVLAQFSEGVLVGQLPEDQYQTYRQKFAQLDLEDFQSQASKKIASIQNKISASIDSIKRSFKDLQLDFESEQSTIKLEKKRLKSTINSIDQAVEDIENFIDKRCEPAGVHPLKISSNLGEESSIRFLKDRPAVAAGTSSSSTVHNPTDQKSLNQPASKLTMKAENAGLPSSHRKRADSDIMMADGDDGVSPTAMNKSDSRSPQRNALDMTKFASRLTSPKKSKHIEDDVNFQTGAEGRHKRVDSAKLKKKLLKQINQIDIQNSEVKRERIQQRQARNVLIEMEEDLAKREKDLEREKNKIRLDQLEVEEMRLQIAMQAVRAKTTKNRENDVLERDKRKIQDFEISMRQKEILRQTEELVKQEQLKLDRIKQELKAEKQKQSEKKEVVLFSSAKKTTFEKEFQVNIVPQDGVSQSYHENNIIKVTHLSIDKLQVITHPGVQKDSYTTVEQAKVSESNEKESGIHRPVLTSRETQTDPIELPKTLSFKNTSPKPSSVKSDSGDEDYFENLHRKTQLNPTALKEIQEETHDDLDVLNVIRNGLPRMSKSHGIDIDLARLMDYAAEAAEEEKAKQKAKENRNVDIAKENNDSKLAEELAAQNKAREEADSKAKNAESKAKDLDDQLRKLKAELEASKSDAVGLEVKVKTYESREKVNTIAEINNKATLGTSPYQSNATLVRKEQKANEQETVLESVTEEHKRLELKATYLEEQLTKARKKDQRLNKAIQDYTKEMNGWLETVLEMESKNDSNPEDLSKLLVEIDAALYQAIPQTEQTISTSKPPSSILLVKIEHVSIMDISLRDNLIYLAGDILAVYELTSTDEFKLIKEHKGII